jgi:hypothetical protein
VTTARSKSLQSGGVALDARGVRSARRNHSSRNAGAKRPDPKASLPVGARREGRCRSGGACRRRLDHACYDGSSTAGLRGLRIRPQLSTRRRRSRGADRLSRARPMPGPGWTLRRSDSSSVPFACLGPVTSGRSGSRGTGPCRRLSFVELGELASSMRICGSGKPSPGLERVRAKTRTTGR